MNTFWLKLLMFVLKCLPGLIAGFQLGYQQAYNPTPVVATAMSTPVLFYPLFWISIGCLFWHALIVMQATGFTGFRQFFRDFAIAGIRGMLSLVDAARNNLPPV